jgi:hypothetical protein
MTKTTKDNTNNKDNKDFENLIDENKNINHLNITKIFENNTSQLQKLENQILLLNDNINSILKNIVEYKKKNDKYINIINNKIPNKRKLEEQLENNSKKKLKKENTKENKKANTKLNPKSKIKQKTEGNSGNKLKNKLCNKEYKISDKMNIFVNGKIVSNYTSNLHRLKQMINNYINEKELQDKDNLKNIRLDDKLKKLFRLKRKFLSINDLHIHILKHIEIL